jgi:hypothetical protein
MSDASMRWETWSPLTMTAPPGVEEEEEEDEAAIISDPSATSEFLDDIPKALVGVEANAATAGLRPHTSPGGHVAEAPTAAAITRIVAWSIIAFDAQVKLLVMQRTVGISRRVSRITGSRWAQC